MKAVSRNTKPKDSTQGLTGAITIQIQYCYKKDNKDQY